MIYRRQVSVIDNKLEKESVQLDALKDALDRSQQLTGGMLTVLSSLENRLDKLEDTIVPIYHQTEALQKRRENIEETLVALDNVVGYYTVTQEVDSIIRGGPGSNPTQLHYDNFLAAQDRLYDAKLYFGKNNPSSVEMENVNTLFEIGVDSLSKEFRDKMKLHSKPIPSSAMLHLVDKEDDAESVASGDSYMVEIPREVKSDLIRISDWLNDHGCDSHFQYYAKLRSNVMLTSLTRLKDENKASSLPSQSGSQATGTHSPSLAGRKFGSKIEQSTKSKKLQLKLKKQMGAAGKMIKGSVGMGAAGARSIISMVGERGEAGDDTELLECYIIQISALTYLMEFELELMREMIPPQQHARVYEMIVRDSVNDIKREGETLAGSVGVTAREHNYSSVLTLCPVLKHLSVCQNQFHHILGGFAPNTLDQLDHLVKLMNQTQDEAMMSFIEGISADEKSALPKDGTVHELTSYVMMVLEGLAEYSEAVTTVLQHNPNYNVEGKHTILGSYITRVLGKLGLNLVRKSESYSDPGLRSIFRLNNFSYILSSFWKSGLLTTVQSYEKDFEEEYNRNIHQQKDQYFKSTWSRAISYVDGNDIPVILIHTGKLKDKDRQNIKDKFKGFNDEIDDIVKTQSKYSIPDTEMKESLKRDNKQNILPKYQYFYEKYHAVQFARNREKYVKYTPADVSQLLDNFFQG